MQLRFKFFDPQPRPHERLAVPMQSEPQRALIALASAVRCHPASATANAGTVSAAEIGRGFAQRGLGAVDLIAEREDFLFESVDDPLLLRALDSCDTKLNAVALSCARVEFSVGLGGLSHCYHPSSTPRQLSSIAARAAH
jgi:hypothetical protein